MAVKKKALKRPAKTALRKKAAKKKVPNLAAAKARVAKAVARSAKKAKPAAPVKKTGATKAAAAPAPLGRPKINADEKLYLVFKEDFHARQVFAFLRVETIWELERYSPQEIFDRLTDPIHGTIKQIRDRLAHYNRHLAGDEAYLAARRAEEVEG